MSASICRSRRGVVEKPLALYPGVPSSIPGSSSLSDEAVSLQMMTLTVGGGR